ncbi:MAG: OmpA family protein [Gammaproteobacteria bacterium]
MEIKKIKWAASKLFLFLFILTTISLQGCAYSDLARRTTGGIDETYSSISSSVSTLGKGNLTDSYQNTSQTTKGVLIGGVTGGVVGGLTTIGVVGGFATGAILGGSLGAYIDAHTSLADRLKNRGAKVFVLGDQVLIVIPSNRLFYTRSASIRYPDYSTLDAIVELIGHYTNISVKVAAYTNATGPEQVDLALSKQQANSVAKYLWKRGISTRLLYAEGYGGTHLVTRNSLDWNCNENYRIEITLEKLPIC